MTSYSAYATRDLRLVLLRILKDQPGFMANDSILKQEARAFGLERAREVIRNELRYLEAMGAVDLKDMGTVMVATLKLKGQEHVDGLMMIEGVNQPSPGV